MTLLFVAALLVIALTVGTTGTDLDGTLYRRIGPGRPHWPTAGGGPC